MFSKTGTLITLILKTLGNIESIKPRKSRVKVNVDAK